MKMSNEKEIFRDKETNIEMDLQSWKKDQFLEMFLTIHLHMRSRYLVLNCGSNYHLLMKTMMELGGCGVLDNHHVEILNGKIEHLSSAGSDHNFQSSWASQQHAVICLDDLEGTSYQICQSHDTTCREKLTKIKGEFAFLVELPSFWTLAENKLLRQRKVTFP